MGRGLIFVCEKCDAQSPKWVGRCNECGAWGTLKEGDAPSAAAHAHVRKSTASPARVSTVTDLRHTTIARIGAPEFPAHSVFRDGLVLGSVTLFTGEPGAGKSTLVLQIARGLKNAKVLYISAEEAASQIKERCDRIGTFGSDFMIAESSRFEEIEATAEKTAPHLLIIDSLQTVTSGGIASDTGSVAQLKAVTAKLAQFARSRSVAVFVIGHVTKDGVLAGPKMLEHLVDAVYYIESDRKSSYRLLRCFKNRYGETGAVCVMRLGRSGFAAVPDAATIFIKDFKPKSGSAITVTEVDRQLFFLEVQALVTKTGYGYAKRSVSGFSKSRLEMLLAVVKKKLHVSLDEYDVYINVAGGFRVHEPAMDFAVAVGVLSGLKDAPVPGGIVVFGEIGLAGEVRGVKDTGGRLREAERHGFKTVVLPPLEKKVQSRLVIHECATLADAVKLFGW